MSRQDRQGVRTPADLERKYDLGGKYNEVLEVVTYARKVLAEAQSEATELQKKVDEALSELQEFYEEAEQILDSIGQDYVVERGTSGIWTYEKWVSGKAVCWGCTETATIDYSVNSTAFCELPSGLFITSPSFVSVNSLSSGGLITNSIYELTASVVSWFTVDHTTEPTSREVKFMVEVIGVWKESEMG